MKVRFTLSIGFPGAEIEQIVEFEDNLTKEELEIEWQEWAGNYIEGSYMEVEQ